jgi:hypothetical protein
MFKHKDIDEILTKIFTGTEILTGPGGANYSTSTISKAA